MYDKSILDYLGSKDYDTILMTTFNFDIQFFERFILNKLYDNDIRKVSLFVDAKELSKSLMDINGSSIGRKYYVTPIKMNSSFHPKVFLLLGKEKARLIVGSANITRSGFMLNNEIFNTIDYDKNNLQNLSLINSAMNFFKELSDINDTEKDLFEELDYLGYLGIKSENKISYFLNNMEKSLLKKIEEYIIEDTLSIDIAVPYYDNELLALKEITEKYPKAKINLYIQNRTSTFNVQHNKENLIVPESNISPFSKCISNDSNNFYHGKVIRFNTNKSSYILYGSANCTLSALSKSFKEQGNIECDLFEKGKLNEFDKFFDNFELVHVEELEHQKITYKKNVENNYSFMYIKNDIQLTIFLSYKSKFDNITITINGEKVTHQYKDDKLILHLPIEDGFILNNLIDLEIKYNEKVEIVKCWYNNIQDIKLYRQETNNSSVTKIKIADDGSIYMEDMELLLRAMPDEIKEIEQIRNSLKEKEINVEESEDDVFQIDEDIPIDNLRKYKEYEHIDRCFHKTANIHFKRLVLNTNKTHNTKRFEQEEKTEHSSIRIATTSEKNFERFVKSKIKILLDEKQQENRTYDEYRNLVGTILYIFDKYKYQEKIENIFLDEYVVKVKLQLLEILLSKVVISKDINHNEENIILSFMVSLETKFMNEINNINNFKMESKSKNIIKNIISMYDIRANYDEYLNKAIETINKRTINIVKALKQRENKNTPLTSSDVYIIRDVIKFDQAKNYMEKLIGFKTKKQLFKIIKKFYGEECSIKINEEILEVIGTTLEPSKYLNKNEGTFKSILKEIKNYSKSVSTVSIFNSSINIIDSKGLSKITHNINLTTGEVQRNMYYSNLNTREENYILKVF